MRYFTLNGEHLPHAPFTVADVQYPANVLDIWSDEELASIGVQRFEEPDAPDYRNEARSALAASDITVIRQVEASASIPAEWISYREALREVVRTGEGPLPARPDWPAGN